MDAEELYDQRMEELARAMFHDDGFVPSTFARNPEVARRVRARLLAMLPCPPTLPAGTRETKPNPSESVTPEIVPLDADADSLYSHGVKRHPVESDVGEALAVPSSGAAPAASHVTAAPERGATWTNAERLAFLERARKA